jgi:hypothetical protein
MDERPEEWLIALGLDRSRRYLIHTWQPMFLGEILANESSASKDKYVFPLSDGRVLSNILFLDDFPPEEQMIALMAAALHALERFDASGSRH